jgi:hypothetical protein
LRSPGDTYSTGPRRSHGDWAGVGSNPTRTSWRSGSALGLARGERQQALCTIRVQSVCSERLDAITIEDVAREGFPDLSVFGFLRMFCEAMSCQPDRMVQRIEFAKLEAPASLAYMPAAMPDRRSPPRYSTTGPIRGECGHKHRHIDDAIECLEDDDRWCIERGGRTDRRICAVCSPGGWRELNADEVAAVELYRRGLGKPSPSRHSRSAFAW